MAIPSKSVIEKHRKHYEGLKSQFEQSLKITFHKWQVDVFQEFKGQIKGGASILLVSPGLKKDLTELLINHYHNIAETFAPGLSFDSAKQSTTGDAAGTEEDDDSNLLDWMLPGIFANLLKGVNAQIALNLPIHENSIINTTQHIGTQSVALARMKDGGDPLVILANKLAARETTVSITETDWIAEATMATALTVTTPAIAIANQTQMIEIQRISPNVTLKELNVARAYQQPETIAVVKRTLAIPQKMWITMGDKKVRLTHQAINGTMIPSTQPFSLSGGLLMFPADSSLGASFAEIVNCRCFALYF